MRRTARALFGPKEVRGRREVWAEQLEAGDAALLFYGPTSFSPRR